jgi:hypothetical protein
MTQLVLLTRLLLARVLGCVRVHLLRRWVPLCPLYWFQRLLLEFVVGLFQRMATVWLCSVASLLLLVLRLVFVQILQGRSPLALVDQGVVVRCWVCCS